MTDINKHSKFLNGQISPRRKNTNEYPITFEWILREEFLLNTENYPKEYHKLFAEKFERAKKRYEDQWENFDYTTDQSKA